MDTSERQAVNQKGYAVATTADMPAGQVAAFDQAVAAYREAARAFADMTGTGAQLHAAEAGLRRAGSDDAGLITLPVAAVHFTDIRADGARMAAVCGSILGGETWVSWKGRCLRHGVECSEYDAYDLIKVRS
jgi:hypothetical protein